MLQNILSGKRITNPLKTSVKALIRGDIGVETFMKKLSLGDCVEQIDDLKKELPHLKLALLEGKMNINLINPYILFVS